MIRVGIGQGSTAEVREVVQHAAQCPTHAVELLVDDDGRAIQAVCVTCFMEDLQAEHDRQNAAEITEAEAIIARQTQAIQEQQQAGWEEMLSEGVPDGAREAVHRGDPDLSGM